VSNQHLYDLGKKLQPEFLNSLPLLVSLEEMRQLITENFPVEPIADCVESMIGASLVVSGRTMRHQRTFLPRFQRDVARNSHQFRVRRFSSQIVKHLANEKFGQF
jgi:hypothetical protein